MEAVSYRANKCGHIFHWICRIHDMYSIQHKRIFVSFSLILIFIVQNIFSCTNNGRRVMVWYCNYKTRNTFCVYCIHSFKNNFHHVAVLFVTFIRKLIAWCHPFMGGLEVYGNTGMTCFCYFPVAESGNMAKIWRGKQPREREFE